MSFLCDCSAHKSRYTSQRGTKYPQSPYKWLHVRSGMTAPPIKPEELLKAIATADVETVAAQRLELIKQGTF